MYQYVSALYQDLIMEQARVVPLCYHCDYCLLAFAFVVRRLLGGILQALLNSVVPTYPERKRSSLDLRLDNTVCWIVVTLSMIFAPWILSTVHLIAIGSDLG